MMDELLVQTLFCMTNTMVLHQSVMMQTDMLRNLLALWSQLFADRHLNMAYSQKHCDLIETMLYNLLKQRSQNIELQNISLEAIIRWIYHYLPKINGNRSVLTHKITKICATLIQIPSFRINSRYIHSLTDAASTSHQLCYFMLQQLTQNDNPRTTTMKLSTISDIKCILSYSTNNGYNADNLYIVLQLIQTIRIKTAKQQQCTSDIDKIINICYSIAIHHSPSSRIGLKLLEISDNRCFNSLLQKLPKKYKQRNNHNVPTFDDEHKQNQLQMYQNQLCSVLDNPLIRGHNIHHHPMRAFGQSSSDLNDSFEDISLDIRRNKRHCAKQQRSNSVPIQFHHLCKINEPNDDDFKEAETYSDKENAANKNKIAGNKRKRDSEMQKEDDAYDNVQDRPSAPKKAKYTKND